MLPVSDPDTTSRDYMSRMREFRVSQLLNLKPQTTTWRGRGLSKSFISRFIIGVTPFRAFIILLITYLLSPLPLQVVITPKLKCLFVDYLRDSGKLGGIASRATPPPHKAARSPARARVSGLGLRSDCAFGL